MSKTYKEEILNIFEILRKVWKRKKIFIYCTSVFILIGIVVAITSPYQYTVNTTMVLQSGKENRLGAVSSLISIAGLNFETNQIQQSISPTVYPQIVSSLPFKLDILYSKYSISGFENKISLYDYYQSSGTSNVFITIKDVLTNYLNYFVSNLKSVVIEEKKFITDSDNSEKIISLSSEEKDFIENIKDAIKLTLNQKDGYISISTKFHEPKLTAEVAYNAQKLLQEYVTNYKLQKTKEQLDFFKKVYNEKKLEFEKAQNKLSRFLDKNKNMSTNYIRSKEKILNDEYIIAYNVFNDISKQYESAKIKFQEDTPIFSIIEPVSVPIDRDKPQRKIIVLIYTLFGLLSSSIIFAYKEYKNYVVDLFKP